MGIIALLAGLLGCTKEEPFILDGPGMVYVPDEDKALFGLWVNGDETVELIVEGDQPYMYILVNGVQTFESPVYVDTENGNALVFQRDDGEIMPLPYESMRLDLENDIIYGSRAGEDGEEPLHRLSPEE